MIITEATIEFSRGVFHEVDQRRWDLNKISEILVYRSEFGDSHGLVFCLINRDRVPDGTVTSAQRFVTELEIDTTQAVNLPALIGQELTKQLFGRIKQVVRT